MKGKTKFFSYLSLLLLTILILNSCYEGNKNLVENKQSSIERFNWDIEFVKEGGEHVEYLTKDSTYWAEINYKGDFDSITKVIFEEEYPMRRIYFYKIIELQEDDIVKSERFEWIERNFSFDTIFSYKHNKIPFEITPVKKGEYYLSGIINDEVYLEKNDSIKYLADQYLISQKIKVR